MTSSLFSEMRCPKLSWWTGFSEQHQLKKSILLSLALALTYQNLCVFIKATFI